MTFIWRRFFSCSVACLVACLLQPVSSGCRLVFSGDTARVLFRVAPVLQVFMTKDQSWHFWGTFKVLGFMLGLAACGIESWSMLVLGLSLWLLGVIFQPEY